VAYTGLSRAIQESAVDASLILTFERSRSEGEAARTLVAALPFIEGFSGIGLAGPELGNPPSKFESVFWSSRMLDLHRVAHAGVRAAVGGLRVCRGYVEVC